MRAHRQTSKPFPLFEPVLHSACGDGDKMVFRIYRKSMAEIVVTGANRGIGRELALQLNAQGHKVIATVRSDSPEPPRSQLEIYEGLDVASDDSVDAFAKSLQGRPIDVLINNAAIYLPDDWRTTPLEVARRQFEVNALGAIRLSRALLGNFHRGAKIIMISSQSGSIGLAKLDDNISYRMSKAALNMASKVLANGLKTHRITVIAVHPGSVVTRMNETGELSSAQSARAVISLIDRTTIEMTGTYWHVDGRQLPW